MLKEVRVTFSDGFVLETNMSPLCTEKEIKEYYFVGRVFVTRQDEQSVRIIKCEVIK